MHEREAEALSKSDIEQVKKQRRGFAVQIWITVLGAA